MRLTPFTPLESLRDEIARADICLGGHFGASDKAGRVVPGKVYQILAMARPLIASDSPANRGVLTHNVSAHLRPPGNPPAPAAAILTLHQIPTHRAQLAQAGRAVYSAQCSEAVITAHLRKIIQAL